MSDIHAVILKCPPGGLFHFGKIALDVDTSLHETDIIPRSDTLFSAIVSTAFKVWGNKTGNQFIQWFEDGDLQISSASYCLEIEGAYFYFLPKPVHYDLLSDDKKLRKVRFISTDIWQKGSLPEKWEANYAFIQNSFVMDASYLAQKTIQHTHLFQKTSLPKVAIHKPGQEDSLYFQTNVQIAQNPQITIEEEDLTRKFTPHAHFYFLLRYAKKEAFQQLTTVLQILADDGIGGERSVGCGRLEGIEIKENPSDFRGFSSIQSDYQCSLSLINPAPEEFSKLKAYKLITRGGRRIPYPKDNADKEYDKKSKLKRVRMLQEGALVQGTLSGSICDITPDDYTKQPFKRNGKAFTLPISSKTIPNDLLDK